MTKPTFSPILHNMQGWDATENTNWGILLNGPWPIYKHSGDETTIEGVFPAAAYDECIVFSPLSGGGIGLLGSVSGAWVLLLNFLGQRRTLMFDLVAEGVTISGGAAKYTIRIPFSMEVDEMHIQVRDKSTSGEIRVDVNLNAVTVYPVDKLIIDANEFTSETALVPAVLDPAKTTWTKGDVITFDVDAAGTGATGLKIWINGTELF